MHHSVIDSDSKVSCKLILKPLSQNCNTDTCNIKETKVASAQRREKSRTKCTQQGFQEGSNWL